MSKETKIYRSPLLQGKNFDEFSDGSKFDGLIYSNPPKRTVVDTYEYCCDKFDQIETYGVRIYQTNRFSYMTYDEIYHITKIIGSGVWKIDGKGEKGIQRRVGVFMETGKEWVIIEHGILMNNLVVVGISTNISPFQMIKIMNECEMEIVFIDYDLMEKFFIDVLPGCESIKNVVYVLNDENKERKEGIDAKEKFIREGVNVYEFQDIVQIGEKNLNSFKVIYPDPEDICLQVYTSGSTGESKGALLSHKAVIANIAGLMKNDGKFKITPGHRCLSYLPFSHQNGQTTHHVFFFIGAVIGFGKVETLLSNPEISLIGDVEIIKPTFFSGVPKVWDNVKKSIEFKVSQKHWYERFLFNYFLNKRLGSLKSGKNEQFWFEGLAFNKVRAMFGGGVKVCISGSAPISAKTQYFMQAIMGKDIIFSSNYGLTETVSSATMQSLVDFQGVSNVGNVLCGSEIKLVDVPDLGYYTDKEEPEGEIYFRGLNLFKGYYKKPKLTKEVFCGSWLKTGDIGRITKNGVLQIIDRAKNFVKIGNAEFIAVESLEADYITCPFIKPNGFCLVPNTEKNFVCAIVLIDVNYVMKWKDDNFFDGEKAKENNINEIIKWKELKKAILDDLSKIAKENNKNSYEYVKDIAIFNEEWNPKNGMTSAAFKILRRKIKKKYEKEINELYKETNEDELINVSDEDLLKEINGNIECSKYDPEIVLEISKVLRVKPSKIDFTKTFANHGFDSLRAIMVINLMKSKGNDIRIHEFAVKCIGELITPSLGGKLEEKYVNLDKEMKIIEEIISEFPDKKNVTKKLTGIFFTGSTGFLGKKLLAVLLNQYEKENVTFFCLVRKQSVERFKNTFPNEVLDKKVIIVEGDLKEELLGMDSTSFTKLKEQIQMIIHAGSVVNHFYHYEDLYDANVRSVFDILRLSEGYKQIHLISSIVVHLNTDRNVKIETIKFPQSLGYASSKFACDVLLKKYYKNLVIYRPSFIGPSTKSLEFNPMDWFCVLSKEMMKTGIISESEIFNTGFDMVSIDFVANTISQIIKNGRMEGKIFEFSMKNVSLYETGLFIEKLTGKPLKRIYDFEEYKKIVIKMAKQRDDKTVIPFVESVNSDYELFESFTKGRYGFNDDLKEFMKENNVEEQKKYSYEDLKPFLQLILSSIKKS